ncbi:hypothetical protein NQ318_006076 [Aromia moschata]|uniref:Selenium-binding protein n=1 Tax=Aromia moschata TaxID=1265417 RepID=A0AAV8Z4S3_9CUCU|nr:hypothetical protein NQ318_006076 [Aromia moschata]
MAKTGPGYATPLEAMKGPREEILYVVCVQPNEGDGKTDLLATVDVDPKSPTYCQIIHRLRTGNEKDELHHSGWNVCSSCYHADACCGNVPVRDKLVLPALGSDRVYIVDTGKNPRAPEIHKVIDASEMVDLDCRTPHTTHCLATGEIMISIMGDKEGNGKCDFILIDGKTYKTKGTWINGKAPKFNYDFWYQPYFDVMASSEWGAPKVFKTGFHPSHATNPEAYGQSLNFFSWSKRELLQSIDLGKDGLAPLEIRFLHNPKESQGYVGCAVNSNVFRFYLKSDGKWVAEKRMITDIIISLDDKYLYLSNWLHGDVRQYDITDRAHPKLTGQVFLGGKVLSDSTIKIIEDKELSAPPEPVYIKGKRFDGAPQMLQLSLDGKRLYVSTSIFSPWDKQFYPEMVANGGTIVKLDVDVDNGGLKLDEEFVVNFGMGPDGPLLPHEMRYPGGDCTSDIWLAQE